MVRAVFASIAVLAPLAPALADGCAGAVTQAQMNECAGKELRAADNALNATYKSVMDRLDSEQEGRKLLVAAEKDWIAYRDSECEFESSGSNGGSIHPMVVTQCRTSLTRFRNTRLQRMLDCKEGDAACPLPPK